MVRVGGLRYAIEPGAAMGRRITRMELNGKPIESAKTYKVAGWASISEDVKNAGGEAVWDVVARHLRARKTVAPPKLNTPKIEGVAGNKGIAS